MSLEDVVKNGEQYALSGSDMLDLTEHKYRVYKYQDLENVNSIDELLGRNGGFILLFQNTASSGHWVTVFKINDKTLEFYDSYGLNVDEELEFTEFNRRRHQGKVVPHLSHLLNNSRYNVISNDYDFQGKENLTQTQTCGRFCGYRLRHRNIPLKEFQDLFKKNKIMTGTKGNNFYITMLTGLLWDKEHL
jgi:hypothetical protein